MINTTKSVQPLANIYIWLVSLLFAAAITPLLMLLMAQLIRVDVLPEWEPIVKIDTNFIMPKWVIDPVDDVDLPEDPPEPLVEPEIAKSVEAELTKISWANAGELTTFNGDDKIVMTTDFIPPTPVFRTPPEYPNVALRQGIEGYVDLKFDVDEAGRTLNIIVFLAEPERVFDKAAIKAVSKWRYDPVGNSGESEYQKGVMARVRFAISGRD